MATEGPSWADQWGAGGIGAMGEDDNTQAKKETTNKKDGGKSGLAKLKSSSFKWIKNLIPTKKKESSSESASSTTQ